MSKTFDVLRAAEMRRRHLRIALALTLIWLTILIGFDHKTFVAAWHGPASRLPMVASMLALALWNRVPRSTRSMSIAFTAATTFCGVGSAAMVAYVRPEIVTSQVISTEFTALVIPLIGLVSWRSAVCIGGATTAAMLIAGAVRPIDDHIVFSIIVASSAFPLPFAWIGIASRERLIRAEHDARAQLAEANRRLIHEALEDQRRLFLMELHDGVKGSLTRAAMVLEASDNHDVRVLDAIRDALVETQDMFGLLEAGPVDGSIAIADLRFELTQGARAAGLDVEMTVAGELMSVPAPVRHAVMRVAREALTNTIRHAKAHRLTCAVRVDGSELALEIADDGRGFGGRPRGRGLESIERRAQQLGGRARFFERDGAVVEITIPLPCVQASHEHGIAGSATSGMVNT